MEQYFDKLSDEEKLSITEIRCMISNKKSKTTNGYYYLCLAEYYREYKDNKKAKKYYKIACKHNCVPAMLAIARLYRELNSDKMVHYYELCISENVDEAIYDLAEHYEKQQNFELSEKYRKIAYLKKLPKSCYKLGLLYMSNNKIFEAKYIFLQDVNDSDCLIMLGEIYYDSETYAEARYYYNKAYELGEMKGATGLAFCYYKEKNYYLAEKYYIIAFNNNIDNSDVNIARFYSLIGDMDTAIIYLKIAHKRGNKEMLKIIGDIYYYHYNNYGNALKYYLYAIKYSIECTPNLAMCLCFHKKAYDTAIEILQIRIKNNYVPCYYTLGYIYREFYSDLEKSNHYFILGELFGDLDCIRGIAINMIMSGNEENGINKLIKIAKVDYDATKFLINYYERNGDYASASKYAT